MSNVTRNQKDLLDEYVRTSLFGPGGKNRRPMDEIMPDLQAAFGEQLPACQAEADAKVKKVQELGAQAAELAAKPGAADSTDLENLDAQAKECLGTTGHSYVLRTFQEAQKKTAETPEAKPSQTISGADFFAAPEQAPMQPIFPEDWKKCKFDYKLQQMAEPKTFGEWMFQYCRSGLWYEPARSAEQKKCVVELNRRFGQDEARIQQALATADAWLAAARPLYDQAVKRKEDSAEEAEAIQSLGGPLQGQIDFKRKKEQERDTHKKMMGKYESKLPPRLVPLTKSQAVSVPAMSHETRRVSAYAGHPNDIYHLKPAAEWNLYIDESYMGQEEEFDPNGKGVIAGALSCVSNPLPPQPSLHASTDATQELFAAGDKVIETLVTHGQCGVLAVPASAYSSAQGWGSLVISYVDLVLRLLPLPADGSKVKLNIFIEGRAPYNHSVDFDYLRDACKYNLMHVFPERARRIDFTMAAMGKNNPHNAYPDLIAHTCRMHGKGNRMATKRYEYADWAGKCFLNYPAQELRNLLEYFFSGRALPAEEWSQLLSAGRPAEGSLLSALMQTLGTEAQGNVDLWKSYLDCTVQHLSSKAIHLRELKAQLSWLKSWQPAEAELPPRVKLLWLTSKLAEANHLGEVDRHSPVGEEFLRLVRDLYEEDAPLVCWAVLHLAVQKTNAYQFEEARKLVTDFSDIGSLLSKEPPFTRFLKAVARTLGVDGTPQNYVPAAIPGLRYYGQLLSSCGQHEAFLGNRPKARIYFQEAIRCFERLSEGKTREIDQTRAYLATAQMDEAPEAPETLADLEAYLGMGLMEAARKLAGSTEDKDKYHHHILLRYLAQCRPAEAVKTYLAEAAKWQVGEGHPWEMIEFYRALLVEDTAERARRLQNAYRIAMEEPGATLHVIGCVIAGAMRYYDVSLNDEEYKRLVAEVATDVPGLGNERIRALQEQQAALRPPLELASIVLPFNFR